MIKNDKEYREAVRRLEQDRNVMGKQRAELAKHKLGEDAINRAMAPLISFHQQLVEEKEWYERAKRQDFGSFPVQEIGRLLIALRIGSGLTQRELARCLRVPESQVSRDERNEYHGITINRAQRILDVFDVPCRLKPEIDKPLRRQRILAAAAK